MPRSRQRRSLLTSFIAALLVGLLIGCEGNGDLGAEKSADVEDVSSGLEPLAPTDPPTGNREPEISGAPLALAAAD